MTKQPKPGQVWREDGGRTERMIVDVNDFAGELLVVNLKRKTHFWISKKAWENWSRTATLVSEGGSDDVSSGD